MMIINNILKPYFHVTVMFSLFYFDVRPTRIGKVDSEKNRCAELLIDDVAILIFQREDDGKVQMSDLPDDVVRGDSLLFVRPQRPRERRTGSPSTFRSHRGEHVLASTLPIPFHKQTVDVCYKERGRNGDAGMEKPLHSAYEVSSNSQQLIISI